MSGSKLAATLGAIRGAYEGLLLIIIDRLTKLIFVKCGRLSPLTGVAILVALSIVMACIMFAQFGRLRIGSFRPR